jgi:hypothetical protein
MPRISRVNEPPYDAPMKFIGELRNCYLISSNLPGSG